MNIRNELLGRMKELGVSNRAMCKDLGLSEANFSSYIHGARSLPYKNLEMVLGYLGLTLSGSRLRDGVRKAMIEQGVRTKTLAEDCDILSSSLSSFLTGQRSISCSKIEKIAEYLGLHFEVMEGFVFRSIFIEEEIGRYRAHKTLEPQEEGCQ